MILYNFQPFPVVAIMYCALCARYYSVDTRNLGKRCSIAHRAGQCCHYNDEEVSKESADKVKAMLQSVPKSITGDAGKCQ